MGPDCANIHAPSRATRTGIWEKDYAQNHEGAEHMAANGGGPPIRLAHDRHGAPRLGARNE